MLDLLIIGASAAGSSAAIYAARKKLNFKIIAKETGGEIATSGKVTNFPGWGKTNGETISQSFQDHLKMYNIEPVLNLVAKKIKINPDNTFTTKVKKQKNIKEYKSKTVIIATGMEPRRLKIPGEKKFRGKGISYCTVCDGPLFQDKTVATIGGGNSALESAIMLKDIAKKVYLINIKSEFQKGDPILIDKVNAKNNIHPIYNATTTKFLGDKFINGLIYKGQNNKKHKIDIQGAFIHIGLTPNSQLTPGKLKQNDYGEIIINKKCQTNISGLFAAGDVTNLPYKQIAIASGQGATAALSAIDYLNKQK